METREITLTTGRKVTIKQPGVLALRAIAGHLPALSAQEGNGETSPEAIDAGIKLVCACSVKPKFAEEPQGLEMSIDDLTLEEFGELSQAITALMPGKEVSPLSASPTN